MSITISTSHYVGDVDIDVELEPHQIIDGLSEEGRAQLLAALLSKGTSGVTPSPPLDRYVEEAFLVARRMPELPSAIKDLFWHVHGRAMP